MKKTIVSFLMIMLLSGCAAMKNWFYETGEKMPTYQGKPCRKPYFCSADDKGEISPARAADAAVDMPVSVPPQIEPSMPVPQVHQQPITNTAVPPIDGMGMNADDAYNQIRVQQGLAPLSGGVPTVTPTPKPEPKWKKDLEETPNNEIIRMLDAQGAGDAMPMPDAQMPSQED